MSDLKTSISKTSIFVLFLMSFEVHVHFAQLMRERFHLAIVVKVRGLGGSAPPAPI